MKSKKELLKEYLAYVDSENEKARDRANKRHKEVKAELKKAEREYKETVERIDREIQEKRNKPFWKRGGDPSDYDYELQKLVASEKLVGKSMNNQFELNWRTTIEPTEEGFKEWLFSREVEEARQDEK